MGLGRRYFARNLVQGASELPQKTPNELANLLVWYDVSDISTLTIDMSNRVSQMNDKSGNSRTMTTTSEPLYEPTGFNGRPSLRFTASNSEWMGASFSSSG